MSKQKKLLIEKIDFTNQELAHLMSVLQKEDEELYQELAKNPLEIWLTPEQNVRLANCFLTKDDDRSQEIIYRLEGEMHLYGDPDYNNAVMKIAKNM